MFDLEGTDFSSHVVPTNEEKCTCGILNSVTEAQNSTQNLQIFPWQVTEIFYKHVLIFFVTNLTLFVMSTFFANQIETS